MKVLGQEINVWRKGRRSEGREKGPSFAFRPRNHEVGPKDYTTREQGSPEVRQPRAQQREAAVTVLCRPELWCGERDMTFYGVCARVSVLCVYAGRKGAERGAEGLDG